MNLDDVRLVIKETVKELKRQGLLTDGRYTDVSRQLRNYYKAMPGAEDADISKALQTLREDPYFEIIPLYYDGNVTLEDIAEIKGVDVSTVTRNKKRLCMMIYNFLEDRP